MKLKVTLMEHFKLIASRKLKRVLRKPKTIIKW